MIRLAKNEDLPALVHIYNQAIRTKKSTGDLEPFTSAARRKWFDRHTPEKYPIYVYIEAGQVTGYCVISPWRSGRQALDVTAEISYYVDFKHHGKGIGTQLVQYAINDCGRIGVENLLAIIQEWNPSSISILKKFEFKEWGFFPQVINVEGKKCGQYIYGKNLDLV